MMPNLELDPIDRKILRELQRDGRITNLALSEKVGLSPSPCLRRVRLLEEAGVVEGYGARLNRVKVGLGITAFVGVTIEKHAEADANVFIAAIRAMDEVVACHITSGDHDFLLEVVVPDLQAFRDFTLERLMKTPGIQLVRSSFAIDALKTAGQLPLGT